jgi:hypothetical protein
MPKKIITVGFSLAHDGIESTELTEHTSLLDWDVVLFCPDMSDFLIHEFGDSEYLGKTCLNDRKSFSLRDACAHWRREISQAVDTGKVVLVFLHKPQEVYVANGEHTRSGTGRNQKIIRHVELINNYSMLPIKTAWTATTGTSIALHSSAREILSSYWQKFGSISQYHAVFASDVKGVCLHTQHGQKPVGVLIRSRASAGAIFLLPDLNFDNPDFSAEDEVGEVCWTEAARQFAGSLISEVVALANALASDGEKTPQPTWASASEYALSSEIELSRKLLIAETDLEKAQRAKDEIAAQLGEAGELRSLLFEKGTRLEAAIISSLHILGFKAEPYHYGESEFDVVFESDEGRLLGEAEGKDNKAINIDKLRQLSTNIHEDLQRQEVQQPAKGILFGNGYRLINPAERQQQFTDKCISSAISLSFGLVSTNRLYDIVHYLSNNPDAEYASRCRIAMIEGIGIVNFPDIPSHESHVMEADEVSEVAATMK